MPRGRPIDPNANMRHPLYSTWLSMRARCNTPGATNYANWGGRGIKVCERWKNFKAFVEDMGPKPSPEHWLERVDNDGDYDPFNCIWALPVDQRKNQRPRQPQITSFKLKKKYKYAHLAE